MKTKVFVKETFKRWQRAIACYIFIVNLSLCVITCNTASSKDIKEFCYSPLNSVCTMCDFINYGTDNMHFKRKYIIWSDLHFIVDEKVKILHFHDVDKYW